MKKTAAVILSVLLAAGACSCSDKKSGKTAEHSDRPTAWTADQRSLDDVTPRNGEEMIFVKRDEEDDSVKLIQGVLSDSPINDENDALDLIASYSEVMGYVDVYSELRFSGAAEYGRNIDYRFDQYYKDVQVEQGFVEIMVDSSDGNKAVVLTSNYTDTWGMSVKPKVSSTEAVRCAEEKYKAVRGEAPKLTIYSGKLAWRVTVDDENVYEVIIDAKNGEMLRG